ncbi:hypothetical protein CJ030_MR5G017225 [Morella rubra]|uniref:Uncharacterized protein n=1 Tax=Morella rubra TaxID=262757 RepID=A0A6A1VM59_9ROSI|nr:hypothetical protein CJ030_MR5G017225 [Morella rubra]
MLDCNWSKVLSVKMISLVREFSFIDKARRREFLDNVFVGMKGVDLHDVTGVPIIGLGVQEV